MLTLQDNHALAWSLREAEQIQIEKIQQVAKNLIEEVPINRTAVGTLPF